jgi:hypothetical protein
MSDITANIVVSPIDLNVVVTTNQLSFTPNGINMNIYTGGSGGTASALNANIANVHIYGGTNGYVLQTDGTGNLVWTAMTGGGGNGAPGGSNTQIQYNNGGVFAGNVGFTFDNVSNLVSMPGNLTAVGTITGTTITGTNANFTGLTVNGISSFGAVGNVQISGGTDGQVLSTNGANGLSFVTRADGTWTSPTTMPIGGIFVGKTYGQNVTTTNIGPGNLFTSNSTPNLSAFISTTPLVTGNAGSMRGCGQYLFSASVSSNVVGRSINGLTWTNFATPLKPVIAPTLGSNNIVIFATSSNKAAYSGDFGSTWSNATLPNSGFWNDLAYGNGTFVMCTSMAGYNNVAVSVSDGTAWAAFAVSGSAFNPNYNQVKYGNSYFIMTSQSSPYPTYRSSTGLTWGAMANSAGYCDGLAYGSNTWVVIKGNAVGGAATAKFSTNDGVSWTSGTIANKNWAGIAYCSPYFIVTESVGNNIAYSTNGNTWTSATILTDGGYIGSTNVTGLLAISSQSGNASISTLLPTALYIDSSDGASANLQTVPNGNYRCLGGVNGNVGALWTRQA